MPRAQAFIPLAKGLDQKLDERLREADSLQVVTNGYYRRNNALTKRHGFTRLSNVSSGASPKSILSTQDELLVRQSTSLVSWIEPSAALPTGAWYDKGEVAPFVGSERPIFSDSTSCISYDAASVDGLVMHVGANVRYTNSANLAAGYTQELRYRIEAEESQQEVVSTSTLLTTLGPSGIGGVKIVAHGTGAGARWSFAYANPAATRLQIYQHLAAVPYGTPTVLITHNDLYVSGADWNSRRYDMTALAPSGQWSYAYVRVPAIGARQIFVATYNGATLLGSWTIPSPAGANWNWVAICDDVANSRIMVCGVDDTQTVWLYSQNRTTGVTFWSRIMHSPPQPVTGVGIAQGVLNAAIANVVITNSAAAGAGSTITYNVTASTTDTGGVALGLIGQTYNAAAVSKPWLHNSRCYFSARVRYGGSDPTRDNYDVEYGSEVIYDLLAGGESAPFYPSIVARYNFGVAPSRSNLSPPYGEYDLGLGSLGQVQRLPSDTSKWRLATRRVIGKVPFKEYIQAADELVVDFDGIATSASTTRGTACLGGANVNWYSGGRLEELGYASAPVFYSAVEGNGAGGTIAPGTYTYIAVFESYDEKGNLIRSMPSAPVQFTVTGGGGGGGLVHHVDTTWYNLGPTQRWDSGNRFAIAMYRADQDGLFQRCTQPLRTSFDQRASNIFIAVRDYGEQYDVLYTQGGAEIEATGPDGAAFVTVTSKRVWLSGFFRRDRIQYSKLYTPATANEFALAPEFNDAFSFLMPGGENVTGLCEMDDKVIVFTRSNIYAIAGNGPDDGGRGNDFSGLQLIASDTGCVDARSICASPIGVFFQSPSGIFVLGRDLQLTFIGAAVRDVTEVWNEITSAVLVPSANHVRFTCRVDGIQSTILIYDFDQTAWLEWQPKKKSGVGAANLNIVSACLHNGVYYVLDGDGFVFYEDSSKYRDDADDVYVPLTIRTGWLQLSQQSGWQRIRKVAALCKSNNPNILTMRVFNDFSNTPAQSYSWGSLAVSNMKLDELIEMHIKEQKSTAFQIELSDAEDGASTTTGQGYECSGFSVELSGKRGLYKPGTQQRN